MPFECNFEKRAASPSVESMEPLAIGWLKYNSLAQQQLGITNVIGTLLHSLFTAEQLSCMKNTVLKHMQIVTDVRHGPHAVLPTSSSQSIPVSLSQLKSIVQRAKQVEDLETLNIVNALQSEEARAKLQHARTALLSRHIRPRTRFQDVHEMDFYPENQYARLLLLVVVHVMDPSMPSNGFSAKHSIAPLTSLDSSSSVECRQQVAHYTTARMYWVGVISTHDPHVVYAELRKAEHNMMDVQSLALIRNDCSATSVHVEDCKLLQLSTLIHTLANVKRTFAQWHSWRMQWNGRAPLKITHSPMPNTPNKTPSHACSLSVVIVTEEEEKDCDSVSRKEHSDAQGAYHVSVACGVCRQSSCTLSAFIIVSILIASCPLQCQWSK